MVQLKAPVKSIPTCILEQETIFSACGTVFVTAIASMSDCFTRSIAGPENMPCVKMPYTFVAPASFNLNKNKNYDCKTLRNLLHTLQPPTSEFHKYQPCHLPRWLSASPHLQPAPCFPPHWLSYAKQTTVKHAHTHTHTACNTNLLVNQSKCNIQCICCGSDPTNTK